MSDESETLRDVTRRLSTRNGWARSTDRTNLLSALTTADYLSLAALFVAWTSALLFLSNEPNWAIVTMFGAFVFDKLDGYWARRTGTASPFGRQIDSFIDIFAYLVTGALLFHYELAPNDVVSAVVGFAGLRPVLAALRAEKIVALANKETMVVGGAIVRDVLEAHDAQLLPVDSEHSAIFQCLAGESARSVEEVVLTASGGPFRTRAADAFDDITVDEALDHPNWSMGPKITIDSATMMNKGLEVIEAKWLFDLDADQIRVLVHPQSIVHSMVCFTDGAIKAELGVPDMKVPIQYALSYPGRWAAPHERLDWAEVTRLDFERPDTDKFACLRLAFEALEAGGTAPAVLNAANEVAVDLFLNEKISFLDIPRCIEQALGGHSPTVSPTLDEVAAADRAARRHVQELAAAPSN